MQQVARFEYKLAGMRKPDSFVVYPRKDKRDPYIAQGNRTIAAIDPETGTGMLNWKGNNPKYFVHLNALGATRCVFPREFVQLVINFCPSSGDLIGSSPETGPVYIA